LEHLRVLRNIAAVAVCALGSLFLLDALTFRTGIYSRVLFPDSYAGQFRLAIQIARQTPRAAARPVLLLGNSIMGEGFSSRIADQLARGRVRFVNAAVPGSSIRAWYYLLREIDVHRDAFSVIVVPVEDYNDEDGAWDRDDAPMDIRIIEPAIRVSDIPEFVRTFRGWDARGQALREALLKGLVYREDLRDLLRHPRFRLDAAVDWQEHGWGWIYGYNGNEHTVSPSDRTLQTMQHRPPSPQTGRFKQYSRYWLNRLMEPYRGGNTRFLVFRVPRNPVPVARYAQYDPTSSVRSLIGRPNAVVADEHMFDHLEEPRYFADALHLNREGRGEFSTALASFILQRFF
jgi:hypothetical protein